MTNRFVFNILRLRERLWVKPLLFCILAIGAAFLAHLADALAIISLVPVISQETIEKLLTIISTTMLAVATFAVGSMVSAYASASSAGTPRVFTLILADDASQTALSSFIGAFIFSIVSIIALKTDLYSVNGHFVLFTITIWIFGWVIVTFVRWVDNIARLGRIGNTIDKAEAAARDALMRRRAAPNLDCAPWSGEIPEEAVAVHGAKIGYVQLVEAPKLQAVAEDLDAEILVAALPGAFLTPERPVAWVNIEKPPLGADAIERIQAAFLIGDDRTFESDPRFGLIVLSEIAAKALSPAVHDPGTAIVIIGRLVRLFVDWAADPGGRDKVKYDRVRAPGLSVADMFDDAFTPIARDGAGVIEVGIRLQKGFLSLESTAHTAVRMEARRHAQLAFARAEAALRLPEDIARLRDLAQRPV